MPRWTAALAPILDLVLPRSCPGCDGALPGRDDTWCPACLGAFLSASVRDYCPRCGRRVGPHLVDPAGCRACRQSSHPLDGFTRVGRYEGRLAEVIKRYKYAREQRLDRPLAFLLADAVAGTSWLESLDALVPVPTSLASRIQYRFRPVELLASVLGRRLSRPSLPLLHVRGKPRKQVELPESQRAHNVRGVFHLRRHANVAGATLCIIDDVSTSGATLREVARVLKRAGAARVCAAVLAKTDPAGSAG